MQLFLILLSWFLLDWEQVATAVNRMEFNGIARGKPQTENIKTNTKYE